MDILVKGKMIYAVAPTIEFGVYDEPFEKWKVSDESIGMLYYVLDDGLELVEDVVLPNDYVSGKYFYENGEFVLNEDWKPYVSPEEKLEEMDTTAVWDEMALAIEEGVNEV